MANHELFLKYPGPSERIRELPGATQLLEKEWGEDEGEGVGGARGGEGGGRRGRRGRGRKGKEEEPGRKTGRRNVALQNLRSLDLPATVGL